MFQFGGLAGMLKGLAMFEKLSSVCFLFIRFDMETIQIMWCGVHVDGLKSFGALKRSMAMLVAAPHEHTSP